MRFLSDIILAGILWIFWKIDTLIAEVIHPFIRYDLSDAETLA